MFWFYDLSLNKSDKIDKKYLIKKHLPSRLNDDLHWRCQICQIDVSTHETEKHIKCRWNKFNDNCDNKMMLLENKNSQNERPKTKKLERPTPNIKHPVIEAFKDDNTAKVLCNQSVQKKSFTSNNSLSSKLLNSFLINLNETLDLEKTKQIQSFETLQENKNIQCGSEKLSVQKKLKNFEKIAYNSIQTNITKNLFQPSQNSIRKLKVKCYLCEKEFTNHQLASHEIECKKKWRCDSKMSPNQRLPNSYFTSASLIGECETMNWEKFEPQLAPCQNCSRTFFLHRVSAHEKACHSFSNLGVKSSKAHLNSSLKPVKKNRFVRNFTS